MGMTHESREAFFIHDTHKGDGMTGTVHIVHAIDTEGPLYESLDGTFERLREIFGVEGLAPTRENLQKLQRGELDFGDKTGLIVEAASAHRVSTLGSWDQIEEMLGRVTEKSFRLRFPDSFGGGWIFNWFCLDHVGFINNPRRRDTGYHNVHDFYNALVDSQGFSRDSIQWHFHPVSTYRDAHRCATHYLRSDEIYQILCRRIIERRFFPSCYRAGFQAERPDSHWFLEQFIPFDISNMATEDTTDIDNSIDFKNGRSGNWRNAPHDWSVYHPSHDDYQRPGDCRRLIARCLNLRNRIGNLNQYEMDRAFARASEGKDTLVGICSHDWRDLQPELELAHELVETANSKYQEVKFRYCQADEGFRHQLSADELAQPPLRLLIEFTPENPGVDVPFIKVTAEQGRVFGPQPFLAIKTRGNRFIHDNFDFGVNPGEWYYAFHGDTLPFEDVHTIGVAANDLCGNTCVEIFNP